jgi:hypothetical protein
VPPRRALAGAVGKKLRIEAVASASRRADSLWSGKESDRIKAAKVKAEQDYAIAKEKCDDKSVADKSACKKEAKAAEEKALADLKAEKKVAAAKS